MIFQTIPHFKTKHRLISHLIWKIKVTCCIRHPVRTRHPQICRVFQHGILAHWDSIGSVKYITVKTSENNTKTQSNQTACLKVYTGCQLSTDDVLRVYNSCTMKCVIWQHLLENNRYWCKPGRNLSFIKDHTIIGTVQMTAGCDISHREDRLPWEQYLL